MKYNIFTDNFYNYKLEILHYELNNHKLSVAGVELNNRTIPIYLTDDQILPNGTWVDIDLEFFVNKTISELRDIIIESYVYDVTHNL